MKGPSVFGNHLDLMLAGPEHFDAESEALANKLEAFRLGRAIDEAAPVDPLTEAYTERSHGEPVESAGNALVPILDEVLDPAASPPFAKSLPLKLAPDAIRD